VRPNTTAVAYVRGDTREKLALQFVRFEPYVLPKKSLTGDATERVDTRVLQAIYRITEDKAAVYVGQQMDVYVEAPLVLGRQRTSGGQQPQGQNQNLEASRNSGDQRR
jgi:hypothetical protein